MKVYLAVPLYGIGVDLDIYENHMLLAMSCNGLLCGTAMPKNRLVHYARNEAVKQILDDPLTNMEEDYIFWLDQDVIVAPGVLRRLLSHDKDFVVGLYFLKEPPFYPLIMKKRDPLTVRGKYNNLTDYPEGIVTLNSIGLQDGAVGFGCALTKIKMFKTIPEPWFEWTKDSGEDIDFCIKAQENGFDIYYDSEVKCGHQGDRKVITFDDFKPFKGKTVKLEMKNVR
jgi:GT2 family glycosyltransferase